ncbi:MAG TPA: hypothetical protein VFV85_04260, partial [Conexibacter sp.]|nr:hypothetical protein [Conexibacter sp.]
MPTRRGMDEARAGAIIARRSAAAIRWLGRLRGAELPNELTALIAIALVATAGMLLAVAVPVAAQEPTGLLCGLALGAGLLAAILFAVGPWLSRAGLHAGLLTLIVGATVLTAGAHTAIGVTTASRAFPWLAVYAALFLTEREARWHALAISAGCAIGFALADVPGTFVAAATGCAAVWIATLLLSTLSARLREQAVTDHLTGLLNRSGFAKAADR